MKQLSFNLKVFEVANSAEIRIKCLEQMRKKYKNKGDRWAYEQLGKSITLRRKALMNFKKEHGLIQ